MFFNLRLIIKLCKYLIERNTFQLFACNSHEGRQKTNKEGSEKAALTFASSSSSLSDTSSFRAAGLK